MMYQGVLSSAIAQVGYQSSTHTLAIRFCTGREYWYAAVPPQIYQALLSAPSIGQYFNQAVRNAYPVRRVSQS